MSERPRLAPNWDKWNGWQKTAFVALVLGAMTLLRVVLKALLDYH